MTDLKTQIESLIDSNNYNEAAELFAKETNTTLVSHGYEFKDHFKEGKERATFNLELKRGNKSYKFPFGASINDSFDTELDNYLDTIKEVDIEIAFGVPIENGKNKKIVEFNFSVDAKRLYHIENISEAEVCEFIEDSEIKEKIKGTDAHNIYSLRASICNALNKRFAELNTRKVERQVRKETVETPDLYTIFACLTKYDPCTFKDFCSDYGYDSDSIKALEVYKAVVKEYKAMVKLYSSDELEILSLIN